MKKLIFKSLRLIAKSLLIGLVAEFASFGLAVIAYAAESATNDYVPVLSSLARLLVSPGFAAVWFSALNQFGQLVLFFVVNWFCWAIICFFFILCVRFFRTGRRNAERPVPPDQPKRAER